MFTDSVLFHLRCFKVCRKHPNSKRWEWFFHKGSFYSTTDAIHSKSTSLKTSFEAHEQERPTPQRRRRYHRRGSANESVLAHHKKKGCLIVRSMQPSSTRKRRSSMSDAYPNSSSCYSGQGHTMVDSYELGNSNGQDEYDPTRMKRSIESCYQGKTPSINSIASRQSYDSTNLMNSYYSKYPLIVNTSIPTSTPVVYKTGEAHNTAANEAYGLSSNWWM